MNVVSAQVLAKWDSLTDEQVVGQILTGQTALFEILMRRHNERVYRVARSIVRDESEAEDVMQQAYVNAYANLRQFAGKARFSTWLTRIAVNEAGAGSLQVLPPQVRPCRGACSKRHRSDPVTHAPPGHCLRYPG